MTSATAISTNQPRALDPTRSRATARAGIGLAVTLVAALGIWGAFATTQSVRAYKQTKRLQAAVEQARSSLALEQSAVRDSGTASGRDELATAVAAFEQDVRGIRANGTVDDAARAASLDARNAQLFEKLAQSSGAVAPTRAQIGRFETRATNLDRTLASLLEDVRGRASASWPAEPLQKLALLALGLLLVVGLSSCAIFLLRLAGHRRRLERDWRKERARLEAAALSDSLTGLGNHRAFHDDMKREAERSAHTGSHYSIVMLDLDGLKEINDTLGHRAGDERIHAVAECLTAALDEGGAYRTGGDEFMVLLPNERLFGGLRFAQRLQEEIARHRTGLRVSCGIAEASAHESADTLVDKADIALYEAKRSGRKVIAYSPGLAPRPAARPEEIASRRHQRLLATSLAQAVDAKDAGTRNHCETVSALCVLIGQALALSNERVEQLGIAGLLHDVGKIGIADALLRKTGALDPDERAAMCGHVRMGQSIVAAAGLQEEAEWILRHHEHIDGSGYPDGLGGSDIPLESRIIHVADAFEAMTANRPYRSARRPSEAFAELERGIGSQFDARCVAALRSVLDADLASDAYWFAPAKETPEHAPQPTAQAA
jgi:diguanylate cyclase (GGDEF)-like protein